MESTLLGHAIPSTTRPEYRDTTAVQPDVSSQRPSLFGRTTSSATATVIPPTDTEPADPKGRGSCSAEVYNINHVSLACTEPPKTPFSPTNSTDQKQTQCGQSSVESVMLRKADNREAALT